MYAIIRTGGKQLKVSTGDVVDVERLKGADEDVSFTPLLVVDGDETISDRDRLGGAAVRAKVLGENKGDKINIFKYKNKTGYRRRQGHRQIYTRLEITEIDLPKAKKKKAAAAKTEEPAGEEA